MNVATHYRKLLPAVAALVLVGAASVRADSDFQLTTYEEWQTALTTGHVTPLLPNEWDEYMLEWDMYLEEGDPYPSTEFRSATLYVYEGAPEFDSPGDRKSVV